MLDLYERLFADEESKDVTFELSDGQERAHRLVLKHASDVWARMFATPMCEQTSGVIKVPTTSRTEMRVFLRLIYTGCVDKSDWVQPEEALPVEEPRLPEGVAHCAAGDKDAEVPLQVLFAVAALAKQYMVSGVLSLATQVLKHRLTRAKDAMNIQDFELIVKAAISSDIGAVRMAALDVAKDWEKCKKQYDAKRLSPEVQSEMEAIWPTSAKKRRTLS